VRGGSVGRVAPASDGAVWFSRSTISDPAEVFRRAPGAAAPGRLTSFCDAALDGVARGEVREVRYAGGGGAPVQMFVAFPPGHDASRPGPLVHVIHGGPHGVSGDAFHPRWNAQVFAAAGYVVAMVNFQGSTSWGQDFAQRIQGAWGDRPFDDVMNGTDALVALGWADPARMAAAGASYGGYLVSWIAGHTDRFRCLVNHAGVFDSWSQYASDVTQGRHRAFGGEPWDRIEVLDRWSPARYAKDMTTPMLVSHGERDYRVPVEQGLMCYSILKAKGVPARLVHFPDENHWVLQPANSLLWHREVLSWLARWLA
jgi:dipeptidyl aminopeptidase/acylaminoacyl peptidase